MGKKICPEFELLFLFENTQTFSFLIIFREISVLPIFSLFSMTVFEIRVKILRYDHMSGF